MSDLADRVREALRLVIDPELGENVVDLGLIYDVSVPHEGMVHVTMTTTTRGCPATEFLREGVATCARAVVGVTAADVVLTYEPLWTPDRMSAKAQSRLWGAP
jgi:metal-sulfur cluster biosynthetic enzyme